MRFRILVLALCLPWTAAGEEVWSNVQRIVAVGDVHGDYDQFTTLLRQAEVIDEEDNWVGGKTHFVQTGDIPDRGPDTRKILELLMKLERQAKKAGGFVHPLIGNHEAMNMYGDLRYVTPEEFAAFADRNSERLRDHAFDLHVEDLKANPPEDGLPEFNEQYRERWNKEHPLGYFEQRNAYNPDGEYGRWIRKNNAVIKINDTIFVHGGLSPKYADWEIEALDKQISEELSDFSKIRGGVAIDQEGPLWYRGLATGAEKDLTQHVDELLEKHAAARIVIGHTPTAGAVWPRFGGKVLMIDVGLSEAYGNRMACLVIENGKPYALHRGLRLELPKDRSVEEMHRYLTAAAALDAPPSPLADVIQNLDAVLTGEGATATVQEP